MEQNSIQNFKCLLEYYISHLIYVQTNDTSMKGYNKYLDRIVNTNKFKASGQGYAGDAIQNQISQWERYGDYVICINIKNNTLRSEKSVFRLGTLCITY